MCQHSVLLRVSACSLALILASFPCKAENIIFPRVRAGLSDASGIVDVTLTPYFADKTGATDVTAVLQKAFTDHQNLYTIYLPNGTYLVSNTVAMTPPCASTTGTGCIAGPILQGQSRAGTVIKLAPGTFTNAGSPKPVLISGDGVAQEFQRGIHNLTIEVGPNNAGANGIRWFSNNQGLMSDVAVVSDDAGANIGVDVGGAEQGPCGMRDVSIKGFAVGISSNALNSVTGWNLTIENSRQYGIQNTGGTLYFENIVCANAPVGLSNQGALTLINAQFNGGAAAKSAIENSGTLYARQIAAQGYGKVLTTSGAAAPAGLIIDEYVSKGAVSLFPSPARSIGLAYKPMPDIEWEQDATKWGNVWVARGGVGTPAKSDMAALQGLIDSSTITTICVPVGRAYQLDGDIFVRGNIKRIVGTGAPFTGIGRLVVTGGSQPAIKIERIMGVPIVVQSDKTVIIESCMGSQTGFITSTGAGDLFISDICGAPNTFNSPTQRVWAWQYNAEGGSGVAGTGHIKTIIQNVGAMRIFGWKDEPQFQSLDLQKGIVEILGYMFYASSSSGSQSMFVVHDGAQFSAACVTQTTFNGTAFSNLVSETRSGVTKTLTSSANGGSNIPLYTGYDSAQIAAGILPGFQPAFPTKNVVRVRLWSGINGMMMVSLPGHPQPACVHVYSSSGCHVASAALQEDGCTIRALPAGIYQTIISGKGFRVAKSFASTR